MKIRRIDIEGFGPFAAPRSITFAEKGVNIVYGGNESGKSTIAEAIYATIFGFSEKKTEDEFASWFPSKQYASRVEFELPGKAVVLSRDFSSNTVTVTLTENGRSKELFSGDASPRSKSEERRAYSELLREFFGFSDGALAKGTSVVSQLDLETKFTPEIRGLVSGAGSADYQGAIEILKSRFENLTVENPWGRVARRKKREIEEAEERLRKTREELGAAETFFVSTSRLGRESSELQNRISQLRAKSVERKEFLAETGRLVELQNSLKEKQRLLRREQATKEDHEKVTRTCAAAKDKVCKDYPLFKDLKLELSSSLAKAVSLEERITGAEKELSERETALKSVPRPISAGSIAAISTAILVASIVAGALEHRLAIAVIVGILVSAAVAAGLFFLARGKTGASSALKTLAQARSGLDNLREERGRLIEEICQSLPAESRAEIDARGLRGFASQYDKFKEARKTVEDFEKQLLVKEGGPGEESYAEALSGRATAENKLEQFLKEHEEFISLKENPEKTTEMAAQAKREADQAENTLKDLEGRLTEKRIERAKVAATPVNPPEACRDEIDSLEKHLAKLALRRDALKLAVEVLEECVDEYQAGSLERVSGRISEIFDKITRGRYEAVRLSEDLEPMLTTREGTDIDPGQISTGAQDQLYFAMRLAMIEELSGDKALPLILDDPFVNFDDERLERARELLKSLAEERDLQIIIFTHGDRHLTWDANIVRLDGS